MLQGMQQGNPAPTPSGGSGGGFTASLKQAINSVHQAAAQADDEIDRAKVLKAYQALVDILATEQKEKESALGTTPAHKYVAKSTTRGGSY